MITFTLVAYMPSCNDRDDYLSSAIVINHFDNEEDLILEIECLKRDEYRNRNVMNYGWGEITVLINGIPCGENFEEDGYETYQRLNSEAQSRFLLWRREEIEKEASKKLEEQARKALLSANETEKKERALLEQLQKKYST